jgi:hypothetical protein
MPRPRRFPLALAALGLLAGAGAAAAQTRPLLTEEATTRAAGEVALEAGAEAIHAEPNYLTGRSRDRWEGPQLRLVYAPAGNVELDVEWTARVGARADPDFGSVSDFGDVALRAKVRLAGGGPGEPALAARFGVALPQTSFGNGLGPNTLRFAAQALVSLPAGRARLHANAGLALLDEPLRAHEQRDLLAYGLAAERPLGGGFTLLAEVAGLAGNGMPGADARSEARAGLRGSAGRWRWDAAVRRGLADADGTWGLTAGLGVVLRAGPASPEAPRP